MNIHEQIWVGEDKFIKWIEFDSRSEPILEIDALEPWKDMYDRKDPVNLFWNRTETECQVECCGICALRFWPEDIARATQGVDKPLLLNQLEELKKHLLICSERIVVYHRLNQGFRKETFLELVNYLIKEIRKGFTP